MKAIYWRWKGEKCFSKGYIQKDNGNILELSPDDYGTDYPIIVLKDDVEIIDVKRGEK